MSRVAFRVNVLNTLLQVKVISGGQRSYVLNLFKTMCKAKVKDTKFESQGHRETPKVACPELVFAPYLLNSKYDS